MHAPILKCSFFSTCLHPYDSILCTYRAIAPPPICSTFATGHDQKTKVRFLVPTRAVLLWRRHRARSACVVTCEVKLYYTPNKAESLSKKKIVTWVSSATQSWLSSCANFLGRFPLLAGCYVIRAGGKKSPAGIFSLAIMLHWDARPQCMACSHAPSLIHCNI
jgi:hypothetical protein